MSVPTVTADNGVEIPQLGLGVWQIEDGVVPDVVSAAFEAGYRHIDTAAVYRNESGVGRAIAASALPREELFVTTKVWNTTTRGTTPPGAPATPACRDAGSSTWSST